jgi:hypothetical protein
MRYLFRIRVTPFRIVVALAMVFELCVVTSGKDWRGITPMHSTRADVHKLLGPAFKDFPGHSLYQIDHSLIEIVFANESVYAHRCPRNVFPGTVLSILVFEPNVSKPEIDLTHFKPV